MLQLIRYRNLLFIIVLQWMISAFIIDPILRMFAIEPLLPSWVLWFLIAGTTLIAAGGYVINDYFDIKIDRINKPDRLIVGESITKKQAMLLYQILTASGIIFGLFGAFAVRSFTLGFIFIVIPGMLWFYSASYKRQLIIGNLVVSLASAIVPLVPLLAESSLLNRKYAELLKFTPVNTTLYGWVFSFAVFAFLWTLIREIIKDIQDEAGDREMECHTIPVVWGKRTAKIIVTALTVLTLELIFWVIIKYLNIPDPTYLTLRYAIIGILIPSIIVVYFVWSNKSQRLAYASRTVKFIMMAGTLYSIIFYYLLAKAMNIAFLGIFNII